MWWIAATAHLTLLPGQLRVDASRLNESHVGKQVVVEGVVKSVSSFRENARMSLHHCNAEFRISQNLAIEARPGENVEVAGTVQSVGADSQSQRLAVDVVRIRRMPSDLTTFEIKARNIADDDVEKWRELAGWARRRYELFQHPELGAKARIAEQKALLAERKLAAGNPTALKRFRDRVRIEADGAEFDLAGLEHEIVIAEIAEVESSNAGALRKLADQIPERLPFDVDSRLATLEPEEQRQYLENPVAWYLLNRPRRIELARFLQATVRARANHAESEGVLGNPESIRLAEAQAADLVRYGDLRREAVRRIVEPLLSRVGELPEKELDRVAALIEGPLGEKSRASAIRADWLKSQLSHLERAEQTAAERSRRAGAAAPVLDAAERLRFAKLWLDWFPGDKQAQNAAAQILIDAYRINSRLEGVENLLRGLGYRLAPNGVWIGSDREASNAPVPAGSAIAVGDKAEKVRDLLGSPTARTRTVGRDWISHVWQYEGIAYILREDPRSGYTRVVAIQSTRNRARSRTAR